MFRLVVHIAADEDEPEHTEDRYFGSLAECLWRTRWPWTNGDSFGLYERQPDRSWLLYYQSL